jgi:hypothetical protein
VYNMSPSILQLASPPKTDVEKNRSSSGKSTSTTAVIFGENKLNENPTTKNLTFSQSICDYSQEKAKLPVEIVWRNVLIYSYLHVASFYGVYLFVCGQVRWITVIWSKYEFVTS